MGREKKKEKETKKNRINPLYLLRPKSVNCLKKKKKNQQRFKNKS